MPNTGPVSEVCFLAGMGGGPVSEEKGSGPERVVRRHLIRGGGGLVLRGGGGQGGAGWQQWLQDTFFNIPSRGRHALPGHRCAEDLHIPLAKNTPVLTTL